ncbi:heavy metal-responsive transcriptional regulator [Streptomyces sp. NBC_01260]|uniref:heavy metal-responsive transcriptional regulator n=1 Tax=unclassified Streptomyces TaxID=2593676 RepID=UPI000F47E23F|nr:MULTISPECIES: heavy metal-responsive transcriptional regulator [unclassified Streptomyces]MCX4774863.1 heavy metal-responsive transcriptional regulator [Streptomyces sp. NBC_01285]ROQ78307.1 DNA-binding transcriptional MerR regulator [Streptomyces sp. CEV 2-1]RPK37448.1 Mercuric resistance operon regulatory protein [Streptomyces sp. ADI92-24]
MRIGDLATISGLTAKTIRYYEQAGLVPPPPRTSSGYRDYPPAAEARLTFIRDAQHAGLTLAEIRGILALRDSGEAPCAHVTDLIHQHLEEINRRIAELRKTRTALRDLAQQAAKTDPQSCSDADTICRIISPPRPARRTPQSDTHRATPADNSTPS